MAEEGKNIDQEMVEHPHHHDPDRVPLKSILKHHGAKYVPLWPFVHAPNVVTPRFLAPEDCLGARRNSFRFAAPFSAFLCSISDLWALY